MSLVERTRERFKNPLPHKQVTESQAQFNDLRREFFDGEIDLIEFRRKLSELEETNGIILYQPGPLYGLLRRLGINKETSRRVADEERAHFQAAKREGLNPRIVINFSKGEEAQKTYLNAFVYYQIPEEIGSEKMREILIEIALAPEKPSKDDLAKLPEKSVGGRFSLEIGFSRFSSPDGTIFELLTGWKLLNTRS